MLEQSVFGRLRQGARIWAIGAVRGDTSRLAKLHERLEPEMGPDDRLVYLGNLLGNGGHGNPVEEALRFRCWVIGRKNGAPEDVVFLRGAQEEMLQKLFELQFAISPSEVLNWMLARGVDGAIRAYGGNPEEAQAAILQSAIATTRWTSDLRRRFQDSGHQLWLSSLKHAAYNTNKKILFVSRGIDARKPLDAQHDIFWWGGGSGFDTLAEPIAGFSRVIRGENPKKFGLVKTSFTMSIDGGCGLNGKLLAVCVSNSSRVLRVLEV